MQFYSLTPKDQGQNSFAVYVQMSVSQSEGISVAFLREKLPISRGPSHRTEIQHRKILGYKGCMGLLHI